MAEGFKIADGYLDIEADVDGALKDIRGFLAKVDGDLAAQEKKFKDSGEDSGKGFAEGLADGAGKGASKLIRDVNGRLRDEKGRFAKAGDEAGDEFSKHVTESIKRRTKTSGKGILDDLLPGDVGGGRGFFGSLLSGAGEFFSNFGRGFVTAFSGAMDQVKTIWSSASTFFQQAGNILGGVGSVATVAGYAALIPIVLGLAGALLQLSAALFLLPAAIGVLIALIAPLIIAFKGFGEAVGAGLSGDVKKFNEALKGLAPSARSVVREFVSLGPILKQIKQSVQGSFFAPLIGSVKPLAVQFLPMLNKGLSTVAAALGRFAAGFLGLLASNDVVEDLGNVFESAARILDRLAPNLILLFGNLFGIMEKGLPWVERLFGAMSDGIGAFAGWLSTIQSNGQLNSWLAQAWEVGKKLWNVMKELGVVLVDMFKNTGDEGSSFLDTLLQFLKDFDTWVNSNEGQRFLNLLADSIGLVGLALEGTAIALFGTVHIFFEVIDAVKLFWHWLVVAWNWIKETVPKIGHFFADLGRTVWGALVIAARAVGDFFAAIGHWFADVWAAVVDIGGKIIDWFAALPGRIWAWMQTVPGIIHDALVSIRESVLFGIGEFGAVLYNFFFTDFPGWVRAGWNWAVQYTIEGGKNALEHIKAFPGQVWEALSTLGSIIGGAFADAWTWAWNYTVEGAQRTWERISAYPGQVWAALKDLGSMIGGFFADAWRRSKDNTVSGINDVMSWVSKLPGRVLGAVSGAGRWLYDAGLNIIRGLVNGIEDMLSWAVEQAKRAAMRVRDGFLSVFEINSPSKMMAREVGGPIMEGIVYGMDRELPNVKRYLGVTAQAMINGFSPTVNVAAPSVSVGGTTLIADLGDGIRQAVPVQIMRNPTTVAAATDEGRRQRGWVYSPRAKS